MDDLSQQLAQRIEAALPGAKVAVAVHGGGHFALDVRHASFAGKGTLARHRLVMAAIAPLMAGDSAPVHAIDTLVTEPE